MNNSPLKIYIAAPYSANTEESRASNAKIAIDAAINIYQKGHFPYIPHLTHWVNLRANKKDINLQRRDYMQWHKPWLETCDALLYLGSSKGADIELKTAKGLGKIIYYSIKETPDIKKLQAK